MIKNTPTRHSQQVLTGAASALTPDGQVAQRIVEQLVDEGLIDATQADSVWVGLAGGAARSADWRFVAETAMTMEVPNAAAAG